MSMQREPENGDSGRDDRATVGAESEPHPYGDELHKNDTTGVLAGVCAGLGDYTRTDPILWRAAFVLTGLAAGTGVFLYIAMWTTMRDSAGGPAMAEQLLNRRLSAEVVLALLALMLGAATALSLVGGFSGGTLVLATPLILGVLTAHNRGVDLQRVMRDLPTQLKDKEPAPNTPPPEPAPTYYNPAQPWAVAPSGPIDLAVVAERKIDEEAWGEGPPEAAEGTEDEETWKRDGESSSQPAAPERGESPPQWGEGAQIQRRGMVLLLPLLGVSALGAVVLVLAGGVSPVALVGPTIGPMFLGGVIALVGAFLIVGAWCGNSRGLVGLGVVLTILAVVTASVNLPRWWPSDETWRPASAKEASQGYELRAGSATLWLTDLELTAGQRVTVEASVNYGALRVLVPETARVVVHGRTDLGEIWVGDLRRTGSEIEVRRTLEPVERRSDSAGDAGAESGVPPTLVVNLVSEACDMEVRRVSS
ncbi:PspC domain-containing protein [Salinactinospora qingdaonensis]